MINLSNPDQFIRFSLGCGTLGFFALKLVTERHNMSAAPAHRKPWSAMAVDRDDAPVGILGVPFDDAVSFRKGTAQAPERIRRNTPFVAPITEEGLILSGFAVHDYGDVERDLNWERYFATVTEGAAEVLKHPFALFIGGDHSVSIPLIKAFSQQVAHDFGVLHLDAHTDLADSYEGHPWSHACTERRVLEYPHMRPEHLVFCGVRAYVEEEVIFLHENPAITVHSARSIHQRGIEVVAQDVIARLAGLSSVYLTLDIDCLDPAFAPGTGTPEAGGLTTRQLLEFLRLIFAALPIRAMDIVEVAPPLDYSDITTWAAIKVIYETFGWLYRR
jgi:agmatinase